MSSYVLFQELFYDGINIINNERDIN